MAWVRLAGAHVGEVWCFYAESFGLSNTCRVLLRSWCAGGTGGREAQSLPWKALRYSLTQGAQGLRQKLGALLGLRVKGKIYILP